VDIIPSSGTVYVDMRDSEVTDCAGTAISVAPTSSGSAVLALENALVSDSGSGVRASAGGGFSNFTVRRTTFVNIGTTGVGADSANTAGAVVDSTFQQCITALATTSTGSLF